MSYQIVDCSYRNSKGFYCMKLKCVKVDKSNKDISIKSQFGSLTIGGMEQWVTEGIRLAVFLPPNVLYSEIQHSMGMPKAIRC